MATSTHDYLADVQRYALYHIDADAVDCGYEELTHYVNVPEFIANNAADEEIKRIATEAFTGWRECQTCGGDIRYGRHEVQIAVDNWTCYSERDEPDPYDDLRW